MQAVIFSSRLLGGNLCTSSTSSNLCTSSRLPRGEFFSRKSAAAAKEKRPGKSKLGAAAVYPP